MKDSKSSLKSLKICCFISMILLIIIIVVAVILFFVVFKPKQPQVTAHPASLANIQFQIFPKLSLNATLSLVITIDNRNYGSFKYRNTTASVDYHGTTVAEIQIEPQTVPSRGKVNISTSANLDGDKLISSPYFSSDLSSGRFNLTSTTTMHGKVGVLKIFHMGAKVFSTCDISVLVQTKEVESSCKSKIKL